MDAAAGRRSGIEACELGSKEALGKQELAANETAPEPSARKLDLITIGRASVDLYGDQVGGRLEDMASFSKYIGGSPTNIAAGASRLGLRAALITRVGDEHFGRFVREQLEREGVDTSCVISDPERLTALAILGIRDDSTFPLLFYRENCADMGLSESDIDPEFIAGAECLCATGTHLSHPVTEAAVLKAVRLARESGARTALDIDFRPNLWGLAGHGEGESRFVASDAVTTKLQSTLGLFDLVVGTEEEFHIAGGSTDTIEALKRVRKVTSAALVCKRGPMGAAAFDGPIPEALDDGLSGPGFHVEVFNVLGAGDGFMAGLLKGWLSGHEWPVALKYANACGAFAVSRHGCTPSYPSFAELEHFLEHGAATPALRKDEELEHIHWATNRPRNWPDLRVFAFDHRPWLETLASEAGAGPDSISRFKEICLDAALAVAEGRDGFGIICDERHGRSCLHRASGSGLWIGRSAELPGSRPIRFESELGQDLGGLSEWPLEHVVKVLCRCHADDAEELWSRQAEELRRLFAAARRNRLETLLEIIPSQLGMPAGPSCARTVARLYDSGIMPDWWKLEPLSADEWRETCGIIKERDPHCRGIVILGMDAPLEELTGAFETAAEFDLVKGFAVGRSVFGAAAERWFAGAADDETVSAELQRNFKTLCDSWDRAREPGR